jgi:hypothetical protein
MFEAIFDSSQVVLETIPLLYQRAHDTLKIACHDPVSDPHAMLSPGGVSVT